MKKTIKKIVIALIAFVICVAGITFAAPLNLFESKIDENIFGNYDLLHSDGMYLTRGEAIRCVFGLLGADDELVERCADSADVEIPNICDLPEYFEEDNKKAVDYCEIGNMLNIAYLRVDIFNNAYLKYDKIMTLKETAVLLQSCIEHTDYYSYDNNYYDYDNFRDLSVIYTTFQVFEKIK